MDYQLAKRLKDAGFPQKEGNGFSGIIAHVEGVADDTVYYPALEELIEACGINLSIHAKVQISGTNEFINEAFAMVDGKPFPTSGSTTTEAVARLWLALHATNELTA
jgi:hypothetical protein